MKKYLVAIGALAVVVVIAVLAVAVLLVTDSLTPEDKDQQDQERFTLELQGDFDKLTFEFSDNLEAGYEIGSWQVEKVGMFSDSLSDIEGTEISESDLLVEFSGEARLKGVMYRNDSSVDTYLSFVDTVCFEPDNESQGLLPRLDSDQTRNDFCFSNQEKAKEYVGLGQEVAAEVVISSYNYFRYPTGGIPYTAYLESVEGIYHDWEEVESGSN